MKTLPDRFNILLIGGGGREHALAAKIVASSRCDTLFITHSGNAGLASIGTPVDVPVSIKEIYRLEQFCDKHNVGLVVIGPEDPLAEGYADALAKPGRVVFGPSKAAAQLEADKAFAKQIMRGAKVPTAEGRAFTNVEQARDYVTSRQSAHVIKAAGLAKGKGVILPSSSEEATAAIDRIMVERAFGDAGSTVLVEERLSGPEVSVLALVDGRNILVLPPCQDHKRLLDGDAGPNTGGMGAFCPTNTLTPELMAEIEREVLVSTVDALRREDIEFRGVLYAGLMLTPSGPKVLEFNVRFGDPECQPLMALLDSDIVDLLVGTATGTLDEADVTFSSAAACPVVLAAEGYPDAASAGDVITGIDKADAMDGVTVQIAGATRDAAGQIKTSGGRVLAVTGVGATMAEARERAYAGVDVIQFAGKQVRRDIAAGV